MERQQQRTNETTISGQPGPTPASQPAVGGPAAAPPAARCTVANDRAALGRRAEDAAVAFLESQGLRVVLRNFRVRMGELDIVARQGNTLVIAEVRCRSSNRFGGAAASVDFRKQQKIRRTAALLLQAQPEFAKLPVRFDVLAVKGADIEWIQHAFT